jgi:hypothetical protein
MPEFFPPLELDDWKATRDTLHTYTRLVGKIRQAMAPPQKHWWHVSLRAAAVGLLTPPIPADKKTFALLLNLTTHELEITTSHGDEAGVPLAGQSAAAFRDETLAALSAFGIAPQIDESLFDDKAAGTYERTAVFRYWQALSQIDSVLRQFKAGFRKESSPVQLWPHHFDLAVVWFSGRHVPGEDPDDPERADEQMNFGFSTGDETIPHPYIYATAYPTPEDLTTSRLPDGAYWHTAGWTGAILPYAVLANAGAPRRSLLVFLRTAHQAGANRMG